MESFDSPVKLVSVDKNINLPDKTWSFSLNGLAQKFSEHIKRSIPFYLEGHKFIAELSDFFVHASSSKICYDLGCSVGELTRVLALKHKAKRDIKWVGIDKEHQMIKKAKDDASDYKNIMFLCDDFLKYTFSKTSFVVSYYSLQFLPVESRIKLLQKIFEVLERGGACVVFEKVFEKTPQNQDVMNSLYLSYKIDKKFTSSEILAKEYGLRGVLKPLTRDENFEIFSQVGFSDISLVMKNFQFEGYLLRK